MHHTVVVNARAGTVLEAGAEAFEARIVTAFQAAGCSAQVRMVHPRELDDALALAIEDTGTVPVIAGGDGTLNGVLPLLMHAGRPVGVLPLGTVNVLGRDLGLTGTLEEQIAALCKGEPVTLDVGSVNDRLFHSLSGMGFFSLMAREREYARRRFPFSRAMAFVMAATRSILFTRPITVAIDLGCGEERRLVEADAVLVTVNGFEGSEWRRPRLDGGVFEVHILNAGGLYSRCKAALSVVSGRWRTSPDLLSFTGSEVTLTRRDKRRGHITFDGEVERKAGPLVYRLLPTAIRLIAARDRLG
ncbi:MAG TPA: diacylglycerol kinase family protein [Bosea sp. (in: a-proteobacteria)]|jgi:diacylglycerol kinase family enzyme|uniref:diacylglycerol/lipid kinase family protein n=1 Tax=Bosea sp. (in: a-proteobacteria) TaxID=1871050 RepID=UPI002DDD4D59|nr:diacylglycerol kinase family protein [Bosea sp. (in: a-proteobacteria)]HEV2554049.1 diacylglycerol kinase family protein [Bosea sp. (in: a-proteobacteria)]